LAQVLAWVVLGAGLGAGAARAHAQVPGPVRFQLPEAAVAQALALVSQAATAIAPVTARVVVQAGVLDSRLNLAPCTQVLAFLPAGVPAWGRTRVGLRCADGAARWQVFLPVQVQVLAPAVVSLAALPAGLALTAAHLQRVECDWGQSPQGLLDDPQALIGRVVQRSVGPGQPLTPALLQARVWFAQGETVRVEIRGSGYSINTGATALAPGVEGRTVRVQTESGRVLSGKPAGERRIEVML
jgi:flagella basal body P-ring formation protein FlgA